MSERNVEEEYFHKLDAERRAALRARLDAEHAALEQAERQKLHHNHCGKCGGELERRDFRGVEIDVCTSCGAVLLDPGELEQLAGEDHTGIFGGLLSLFGRRG